MWQSKYQIVPCAKAHVLLPSFPMKKMWYRSEEAHMQPIRDKSFWPFYWLPSEDPTSATSAVLHVMKSGGLSCNTTRFKPERKLHIQKIAYITGYFCLHWKIGIFTGIKDYMDTVYLKHTFNPSCLSRIIFALLDRYFFWRRNLQINFKILYQATYFSYPGVFFRGNAPEQSSSTSEWVPAPLWGSTGTQSHRHT